MKIKNLLYEWNIIEIKADLLCLGIHRTKSADNIFKMQNPGNDWKTGNVGIHIVLENGSYVLVTMSHSFDQCSPYHIENDNGDKVFQLYKDNSRIMTINSVLMPQWYLKKTQTGKNMSSVFLHEGRVFLHQTYRGCDFHRMGLPCKFCGTGIEWDIGSPIEIADTVEEAYNKNQKYQVCLGGGTRIPFENNIEYFLDCVSNIRNRVKNIPIWLEMVPPDSDNDIERLVNAGVTSFGFNVEIWDEILGQEICPGKYKLSKYLSAMKIALSLVGSNRVGSCLIIGIQPVKEAIQGVIKLATIGVQPCIVPFKPWDGSLLKEYPQCKPSELIGVSKIAAKTMLDNNISPDQNQGCMKCESCTIERDIYKLNRQYGQFR